MRLAFLVTAVVTACAVGICTLTAALPVTHLRQRMAPRFRQHQTVQSAAAASAAAAADTATDATVNVNADAEANTIHALMNALIANSNSKEKMSSQFRAAVQQELHRMNARDAARLHAEFGSARAQAVARAEVEAAQLQVQSMRTGSRASAWDNVRSPAVCKDVWAWLAGLNGGFNAAAGPAKTDAEVVTAWGAATNIVNYNAVPDKRFAADLIAWIRFMYAGVVASGQDPAAGGVAAAICVANDMQIVIDAQTAREVGGNQFAAYSLGVEWEVNGLQSYPRDTLAGNDPVVMAESAGSTFGSKYVTVEADSSRNAAVGELANGYNIPEFVFGPRLIDPNDDAVTKVVLTDTKLYVTHFKAVTLALARDDLGTGLGSARGYKYVKFTDVCTGADDRNKGNNGGVKLSGDPLIGNVELTDRKDPRVVLGVGLAKPGKEYTGGRDQFYLRPTGVRRGTATLTHDVSLMSDDYVQTNFLMPISSLASAQFAGDLVERYQGAGRTFISAVLVACQTAARDLLSDTNQFPAAAMNSLSGAQRGDLLGVITLFNYHFIYRWYCSSGGLGSREIAWGDDVAFVFDKVHGAHWKNWFDIMPKTSVHKALELVHPAVAFALYEWSRAQRIGDNSKWAGTLAYFDGLSKAMVAGGGIVKGWADTAAENTPEGVARRTWAIGRLLIDLNMFNPAKLRNPPPTPPSAGHAYSTSPTHSRPKAFLVGAAPDGVLSIVMEARDRDDVLNQHVFAADEAQTNTWLKRHLKQKTWDYQPNTFTV